MQFHRYSPYSKYEVPSQKLQIWSGGFSQKHVLKTTPNQDRYFFNDRAMGVVDGVGGVASAGLDPAAMALELNMRIPIEMDLRLSRNAQKYDRDTQLTLATSVGPQNGGWLRNLCALSFLKTENLGSTTLGVSVWHLIHGIQYTMYNTQDII